ncbi:MAG TPA: PHP domain-containing protein [Desulfobacteria bacterium]|nr:PHP domain-containing protein [Desulfobacteria bacterium]
MKFTGDYHMHSTYSDGRASLAEMVDSARRKGLKAAAITDHGPRNIRTGVRNAAQFLKIKAELQELNKEYPDIKLWAGCEADIVGLDGEIDVPPEICQALDLVIVGLHPFARPNKPADIWPLNGRNQAARISQSQRRKVINTNTKTLIAAMDKHPVDIISHPGLGMPIETREVARACVRNDVMFEINCGHHFPSLDAVLAAAQEGVQFIVDSDAHFIESVGKLTYGSGVLEQAGIPPERVANAWQEGKEVLWEN